MIKWYYNSSFLENKELLFIISVTVILLIILITICFDYYVLKRCKRENK